MYKGHVDFKRLYMFFHKQHTFFVTRAKKNMKYVVVGEREVDKSTGIISDQDIRLIGVRTSTYYPDNIRMVTCEDYATGNVYRFITNVFDKPEEQESLLALAWQRNACICTNDFSLPALTIDELYRERWTVGCIFKWL